MVPDSSMINVHTNLSYTNNNPGLFSNFRVPDRRIKSNRNPREINIILSPTINKNEFNSRREVSQYYKFFDALVEKLPGFNLVRIFSESFYIPRLWEGRSRSLHTYLKLVKHIINVLVSSRRTTYYYNDFDH